MPIPRRKYGMVNEHQGPPLQQTEPDTIAEQNRTATVQVFRLMPDGSKGEFLRTEPAFPEGLNEERFHIKLEKKGEDTVAKPIPEDLKQIFADKNQSINSVANHYHVTWHEAKRWLKESGLLNNSTPPTVNREFEAALPKTEKGNLQTGIPNTETPLEIPKNPPLIDEPISNIGDPQVSILSEAMFKLAIMEALAPVFESLKVFESIIAKHDESLGEDWDKLIDLRDEVNAIRGLETRIEELEGQSELITADLTTLFKRTNGEEKNDLNPQATATITRSELASLLADVVLTMISRTR